MIDVVDKYTANFRQQFLSADTLLTSLDVTHATHYWDVHTFFLCMKYDLYVACGSDDASNLQIPGAPSLAQP